METQEAFVSVRPFSVAHQITGRRIADLMVSFIESGDPVTRSWCGAVRLIEPRVSTRPWYDDAALWERDFLVQIEEVEDERTGKIKVHNFSRHHIERGLAALWADKRYAHHLGDVINESDDAGTADIFMQFCLFGEEKYA